MFCYSISNGTNGCGVSEMRRFSHYASKLVQRFLLLMESKKVTSKNRHKYKSAQPIIKNGVGCLWRTWSRMSSIMPSRCSLCASPWKSACSIHSVHQPYNSYALACYTVIMSFASTGWRTARMLVEIRAQSIRLAGCQGLDDVMYHVTAHRHHEY